MHKIGIVTKPGLDPNTIEPILRFLRQGNEVVDAIRDVDFVIAFGGDGTMLGVMRSVATDEDSPILLGVNLGTVGFITDIGLAEAIEKLDLIINKHEYLYEARSTLLLAEPFKPAANDILLQRAGGRLLAFDVFLEDRFAYSCRADGLLISTPTGSTAYSLAAGGPIIGPCVDATLITPMMPQNLSSRPLIVTSDTDIKVKLTGDQRALVYIDGNELDMAGQPTTEFHITQGPSVKFGFHTSFAAEPRDFTKALRSKLGWNS